MEVERWIRENVPWTKLTEDVKQVLGNSQREYEKLILEYSVKNQLRWKGNLVKYVKKSEETYYDMVVKYSASHLMLFPYHLADIVVRELRITPFSYYIGIITEMINAEKSYDSLPNFTAADAMRLLGIGRNQYIELMNQNRSNRKFLRRGRPLRELLPPHPVALPGEPWWTVHAGSVLENDIKSLSPDEKRLLDSVMDGQSRAVGQCDKHCLMSLFHKGLVYWDVPVGGEEYVYVAPLDGFVMNRVLGDYFETLLYKIFVAINDQTTVNEIADMLHIDPQLARNAVSLFCRLGFARKRVTGSEGVQPHPSWHEWLMRDQGAKAGAGGAAAAASPMSPAGDDTMVSSVSADFGELTASFGDEDEEGEEGGEAAGVTHTMSVQSIASDPASSASQPTTGGRVGFVFDSTLTAFLMMGNLSATLKGHAVTLFEVGKLSEEQLADFMENLENVNCFAEGEAQRYSQHAVLLLHALRSLREGEGGEARALDLLRGESLLSLDSHARARLLHKSYSVLVSMAPLSSDACTIPAASIPMLAPPIPECCSGWLRLAIYALAGNGAATIFVPKGARLRTLPSAVSWCDQLLLTPGGHEPHVIHAGAALALVNDTLTSTALLVQEFSSADAEDDEHLVYVPFPSEREELDDEGSFANHPAVAVLREKLHLQSICGYVTLMRKVSPGDWQQPSDAPTAVSSYATGSPRKTARMITSLPPGDSFSNYCLFDCVVGVPLHHSPLNSLVCHRIRTHKILDLENHENIRTANKCMVDLVRGVMEKYNDGVMESAFCNLEPRRVDVVPPVRMLAFDPCKGQLDTIDWIK